MHQRFIQQILTYCYYTRTHFRTYKEISSDQQLKKRYLL